MTVSEIVDRMPDEIVQLLCTTLGDCYHNTKKDLLYLLAQTEGTEKRKSMILEDGHISYKELPIVVDITYDEMGPKTLEHYQWNCGEKESAVIKLECNPHELRWIVETSDKDLFTMYYNPEQIDSDVMFSFSFCSEIGVKEVSVAYDEENQTTTISALLQDFDRIPRGNSWSIKGKQISPEEVIFYLLNHESIAGYYEYMSNHLTSHRDDEEVIHGINESLGNFCERIINLVDANLSHNGAIDATIRKAKIPRLSQETIDDDTYVLPF